jgi:anti-sigma-K factor RskA
VTHEEAWARLPDLLDDRDDAGLLAHVRACADCQRQLFLLGRVDRLLRDDAAVRDRSKRHGLTVWWLAGAGVAVAAAAAAAVTLVLFLSHAAGSHDLVLRTSSGRSVGTAVMGHSDSRNASVALIARGLPVKRSHVFVLWAGDDKNSVMQVGRFMVDQFGSCRVRFNLPATHAWGRFWVTEPRSPATVVART